MDLSRGAPALGWALAGIVLALAPVPSGAADDPDATAMFRASADHAGVYAAAPGHAFGGIRWTFATGGSVRSWPTLLAGVVYVGSTDGSLYALGEANGQLRWRYDAG